MRRRATRFSLDLVEGPEEMSINGRCFVHWPGSSVLKELPAGCDMADATTLPCAARPSEAPSAGGLQA